MEEIKTNPVKCRHSIYTLGGEKQKDKKSDIVLFHGILKKHEDGSIMGLYETFPDGTYYPATFFESDIYFEDEKA